MIRNADDGRFGKQEDNMAGVGPWLMGALMVLVGFFGLFAASRAVDSAFHVGGWLMFAGSLVYIFTQVKGHFDRVDRGEA